jgi:hypothetical protein
LTSPLSGFCPSSYFSLPPSLRCADPCGFRLRFQPRRAYNSERPVADFLKPFPLPHACRAIVFFVLEDGGSSFWSGFSKPLEIFRILRTYLILRLPPPAQTGGIEHLILEAEVLNKQRNFPQLTKIFADIHIGYNPLRTTPNQHPSGTMHKQPSEKNMRSLEVIYPRAYEQTAFVVPGEEFKFRKELVLRAENLT